METYPPRLLLALADQENRARIGNVLAPPRAAVTQEQIADARRRGIRAMHIEPDAAPGESVRDAEKRRNVGRSRIGNALRPAP